MRRLFFALFSAFLLLGLLPSSGRAQYVLLAGHSETSLVRLYNVDGRGNLSLRSSFDIRDTIGDYGESRYVGFSPKGNYAYVHESAYRYNIIYSVASSYVLRQIAEIAQPKGNIGGAVAFHPSEEFLFAEGGLDVSDPGPNLNIYRLEGDLCRIVYSSTIPTTAGLLGQAIATRRGEFIGAGINGYLHSPDAFVVYQFDPLTTTLALKQYIPKIGCHVMATDRIENLLVCAGGGNQIYALTRKADGEFQLASTTTTMDYGAYVIGLAITSDSQYLIANCSGVDQTRTGFYLYRIAADGHLTLLSRALRYLPSALAMTPDGRFFVGGYGESKLGVFTLDRTLKQLDEVFTLESAPYTSCLSFHPTARPQNKADGNWCLYN